MGPTLRKGKVYGKMLLDEVKDIESFDNLVLATTMAFAGNPPEDDNLHYLNILNFKDLTNEGKRWKTFEKVVESEWDDEEQDYVEVVHYEDNPWAKYFNYSDYAYVKNLTGSMLFMEDEDGNPIDLAPGQGVILHYGDVYVKPDDEEESKESTTPVPPPTRLQQYEEVAKLLHGAVDTIIRNTGIKVDFDTPIPYGIGVDPFLLVAESRFKAAIKDVEPHFLEVNTVGDILKKIDWALNQFIC